MAGTDTVRGIAYQQAQAVLAAIDLLDDGELAAIRVEGIDDVVDIEFLSDAGLVQAGKQVKIRASAYTWGKEDLLKVLKRWATVPKTAGATFEFLTDGRLGPTGEDVQRALEQAAAGFPSDLALLLGVPAESEVCQAVVGASIRLDPTSASALLGRAEGQVAARLPAARTQSETEEEAARAVTALHRLLFDRASEPDPQARIISRQEIAECLGLPAQQPPESRWGTGLRDRYLAAAGTASHVPVVESLVGLGVEVRSSIHRIGVTDLEAVTTSDIVAGDRCVVLAGRTGSGKSTAVSALRRAEALAGRVVIVAHAETYLPGRLAALVADGLSEPLGEAIPPATGRQLLADPQVTLVVDGASEVPGPVQEALTEEIGLLAALRHGARVVLVGRDVATLRSMLPTVSEPDAFTMIGVDASARQSITRSILLGQEGTGTTDDREAAACRAVCAQAERALGDACGNPLLFTMAVAQIASGVPFTDTAALYQEFIAEMAKRKGAVDLAPSTRALGIVYARLLGQGRRYADSYEWATQVEEACASLSMDSVRVDPTSVMRFAERTGLVSRVGFSQIVVPVHDSVADFLAALAHAHGLSPLPDRFESGDEQRVMFLAELSGVNDVLAARVANELPFLTPRMADFDSRPLQVTSVSEVRSLLKQLLPEDSTANATFWVEGESVVAAILSDDSAPPTVGAGEGLALSRSFPTAALSGDGPLGVVSRLWRLSILSGLAYERAIPPVYPSDSTTACTLLAAHAHESRHRAEELAARLSPSSAKTRLLSEAQPLGLDACIGDREDGPFGRRWPVRYRSASDVHVTLSDSATSATPPDTYGGSSTVESLLDLSPAESAAKQIRQTINRLVGRNWL